MRITDRLKRLESFRPGVMQCGQCGAEFPAQQTAHNRLDDPVCPKCGSVNIRYEPTRAEKARSFLINYNLY